jgi:hypothetical protein
MGVGTTADLCFNQSVEYKTIELYRCHFDQADEESVRRHVAYKFRVAHFRMNLAQSRLRDVA